LDFPNPIGLAAGFDKDAEVYDRMGRFGFGFVEVGTVTPLPQAGNPRPRLFRLAEDRAVINRMGFNNEGIAAAAKRLERPRRGLTVGVNIGANKESADRIGDYAQGVRAMAPLADYLTVNISSPNTPGLRDLQDPAALAETLSACIEARGGTRPPLFLKVAPDLDRARVDSIARTALDRGVDALIVANTTISRPWLASRHREEAGGLSGAPLKALALAKLREFRSAAGGALPLVAAGGIENGVDAWDRIRAGASLVQLYSAMVYQGPAVAHAVAAELRLQLQRHGFATLAEAVGTGEA
jgi:dihydroorotate dehydrogenase